VHQNNQFAGANNPQQIARTSPLMKGSGR